MKNIHKIFFLPLFAALAISCSSPTSLQTSEYDDVYYSKKDKTIITDQAVATAAAPAADNAAEEAGVANPEYSQNNSGGGTVTNTNGTDYYSPDYYDEDDYYYASRIRRFNAPYRGLSYYDFAYTDYYWYNRNPMYYGRSIYYDPFYSDPFFPCYTCYGYPSYYGGINIIIGRPFYSRWGSPYYGGLHRGYYGGGYGGYGGYANSGWYRNDNNLSRKVQYGPRRDRSAVPAGNNGIAPNRSRTATGGSISGGGGVVQPEGSGLRTNRSTRGRAADNTDGTVSQPEQPRTGTRGRVDRSLETAPADRNLEPANTRRPSRSRVEELETAPAPREERVIEPRRTEETPSRSRRSYEPRQQEPRQQEQQRSEPRYQPRQRTEESRPQPTYQAPQRQERTYSAPSSSPSYNAPSRSSGDGGSNSGGSRSSRGRGN
jgi:hypothetical protein